MKQALGFPQLKQLSLTSILYHSSLLINIIITKRNYHLIIHVISPAGAFSFQILLCVFQKLQILYKKQTNKQTNCHFMQRS